MLDFIRDNAQSTASKIILGLIAAAFVFAFGGGASLLGNPANIAQVGDKAISINEFVDARNRTMTYYREQYGNRLTPELLSALDVPGQTLRQLVSGAVLEAEAERLGLTVPDESVRSEIREIETFHRNGQFSPAAYREQLQLQGLSTGEFEENVRQGMLVEQLVDVVRRGVHVNEAEALEEFRRGSDKIVLDYVKVSSADLRDAVEVTDDELAAYFAENDEAYRVGDGAIVRYLEYAPESFADPSSISDAEITSYYEANLDEEFTQKEKVGARHILKSFDGDTSDENKAAKRAEIDAVMERLNAGEDFAEVAKEASEDKGSGASGGDLGLFARGRMVKPFEEAAFELEVGQTSDVVESAFGYHIIKVYDRQAGGVTSLEDARDDIALKLAKDSAADETFDAVSDDALAIQDGVSLETIAEERGFEIKTSPTVRSGELLEEIKPSAPFVAAALALSNVGDTSDAVRVGKKYYIMALAETVDSYIPEIADVHEAVEDNYRNERSADLAKAQAEKLLERVQGGTAIADLEESEGVEVGETPAFAQPGGFISGVGSLPAAKEAAFALSSDGEVLPRVYTVRGDAFVFSRKSYEQASEADFEAVKDERLAVLRRRREQVVIDEFVRELEASSAVTYNRAAIDQFVTGNN